MKRKRREKRKFTDPENMEFWQLVDWDGEKENQLVDFNDDKEEKKQEWECEWALEGKDFNSGSVDPISAYYDDLGIQIALFHSAKLCSSSTTTNQDSSKKIAHDVKKKGICTGPVPLRTFGSGFSIRERGEPSCTYCVICDDAKPTRSLMQSGCWHYFCEDCIRIYLGEKIQENILSVKCPGKDCKAFLEATFWRRYVPEEVFDRWKKARLEGRILASPKMIKCPRCFGEFADDGRDFLIRACPKCWKIFCMKCRVPWHMEMSCEDFQFEFEFLRRMQFWKTRLVLIP